MAAVLNKQTLEYLESVNTPDYHPADWIINPDLSALTKPNPYWVVEGATVRDMTIEEELAYDASLPVVEDTSQLNGGMPAYFYAPANCAVSIERATATFSLKSSASGVKNVYLDCSGVSSSDVGFSMMRNAVVKAISVSYKGSKAVPTKVHLRAQGSETNLHTIDIGAGSKSKQETDIAVLLNAGQQLSCYIESSVGIINPVVVCEINWRN